MIACAELPHFWISEPKFRFSIYIKNRSFDSFSQIKNAFSYLIDYGILLNDNHYVLNDLSCTN